MAARAAVYSLLDEDAELGTIGVQAVYASNSIDTPGEEFFLVIRWETPEVAFKNKGTDHCTVWAHDRQRDYGRIDQALERVKELLTSTVHRTGDDGWTMTCAEWRGDSPDLVDGGFNTLTRNSDFAIPARYATA